MATPEKWEEGDRVLAPWEAEWLYPGTIRCIDEDVAFIKFDDGDRGLVPLGDLQPLAIRKGGRVYARWNQGPKRYDGALVLNVLGEELQLRYDDGREESTTVSFIRIPRYQPSQLGASAN